MRFKDRTLVNGLNEETLSYAAITQGSMKFAISLNRLGVGKGQTVAICSENRSEYWAAVIGAMFTGAAVTTVSMWYTEYELTHILNISKPGYMICSPTVFKRHEKTFRSSHIETIIVFGDETFPNTISFKDMVSGPSVEWEQFQVPDANPHDTVFVLYSSGTTGLPKGVMLTHLNLLVACSSKHLQWSKTPSYLTLAPWFHIMGLLGILLYFSLGINVVYIPRFEIEHYLKTIEKFKITCLVVAPPTLVALLKHPDQRTLDSIEFILSAAAPVKKDTLEAVKNRFPNLRQILQVYGMTETTLSVTRDLNESATPKLGSVGRVVSGVILKVVDLETGKTVGIGQRGEICVKGGLLMKGYVGKGPREDDEEGFFRTGDVGYYDQDGYFYIVDRIKDLIKYNGYQVAPAEIEAALLQHGAVREAGVVGVPDARAGELPRAFVALQPGARASEQELQDFVAQRLSNSKWLRGGVCFVREVPKNPSGKILRHQLRALLRDKSKL